MEQTIFIGVHAFLGFIFFMYVVPELIKRNHMIISIVLTLSVFILLAQLNPNNFDFIDRVWRGGLIGLCALMTGLVKYYITKKYFNTQKL